MKKLLLLLFFALAATAMRAQNGELYSIGFHEIKDYKFNIENGMRQHDGELFVNLFLGVDSGSPYQPPINFGNLFYKMSRSSFTVIDSLLVENPDAPFYLFAKDPNGEGNIRANFEYNEDCDSSFLHICHFPDNDLNINHEEDILTPVCKGYSFSSFDSHIVDSRGDLIMEYGKEQPDGTYNQFIVRCGPEGTLKHQSQLLENSMITLGSLQEYNDSPLQYYQLGYDINDLNLHLYVMDSLLQTTYSVVSRILTEEVLDTIHIAYEAFDFDYFTQMIPLERNEVLLSAGYVKDTLYLDCTTEHGIVVAKFDLRTTQLKDFVVFNDFPGDLALARVMGFKMMSDRTVYLLYQEQGYPEESLIAVKMDTDLNMEWKRFIKTDNISIQQPLSFPNVYEEEQEEGKGIGWFGPALKDDNTKQGFVYFFLNHDGTVNSINNNGIEVRPYCFYPNPANDQLHLQYSPDVQPTRVELFDLQGRLVRTQSKAFESIDMSQLPTGTYTLRVTLEDGKTYADKVVKE